MGDSNRTSLYYGEEVTWGTLATCTFQGLRFTGESFAYNITNVTSAEIRSDRQITDLIQSDADTSGGFNFEFSYDSFNDLLEGALWSDWSTAVAILSLGISFFSSGTLVASGATVGSTDFSLCTLGQWIEIRGSTNTTNNGYFQITSVASTHAIVVTPAPETKATGDPIAIGGAYLRNGTIEHSYSVIRSHAGLATGQYFTFLGQTVNTFNLAAQAGAILTGSFDFMGKTGSLAQNSATALAATAAGTTVVLLPLQHY